VREKNVLETSTSIINGAVGRTAVTMQYLSNT